MVTPGGPPAPEGCPVGGPVGAAAALVTLKGTDAPFMRTATMVGSGPERAIANGRVVVPVEVHDTVGFTIVKESVR